jgi:hypothetical protein
LLYVRKIKILLKLKVPAKVKIETYALNLPAQKLTEINMANAIIHVKIHVLIRKVVV